MNEFAGVLFAISARSFFQFLLHLFFNFRESFHPKFETREASINTPPRLKFLQSRPLENFVNRRSTDAVSLRELSRSEI